MSSIAAEGRFEILQMTSDGYLDDWAVYDRATKRYAYGHWETVHTIYEEVTSNPDNAKHWGWTGDGPFRPIKDMFDNGE